jgi:Tfp pilus assembly protein PilO
VNFRDPQTQKGLLAGIVVLGLAYAFHEYLYKPREIEIGELETQATRLESYNTQAKQAAQGNRVATLEEESVGFVRRLEAFEELIPTTEQVPDVLAQVATAALESDVDLLSFTPLPAEPGSFYTEQFYEVEVRGGYHALGEFVTRVANLPRIVKPALVEVLGERVEARNAARSLTPLDPVTMVRAKLQLSTYVLPGGEARVAGADSAGVVSVPPAADPLGAAPVPPAAPPARAPGGLAPGVAPGVAPLPDAAATPSAAAGETPAAGAPGGGVTAPSPVLGLPAAGSDAAAAQAAAAHAAAAGVQVQVVPAPDVVPGAAAPMRADPGALPTPGQRSEPGADASAPGALPALGTEDRP